MQSNNNVYILYLIVHVLVFLKQITASLSPLALSSLALLFFCYDDGATIYGSDINLHQLILKQFLHRKSMMIYLLNAVG